MARFNRSLPLALAHLAAALLMLLITAEVKSETVDWAALTLAHAQVLLVALWAAFGRVAFPLRWAALAATTASWCWLLAQPGADLRPLWILGTEAVAALVGMYAARGLGLSIAWQTSESEPGLSPPRRYGMRELLVAMISAGVVFALLRAALALESDRGALWEQSPETLLYLAVFRAAYVMFALLAAWAVLGDGPTLRRAAWLATFVVVWIALTLGIYQPAEDVALLFAGQRVAITALFCGTLAPLRREGLRLIRA